MNLPMFLVSDFRDVNHANTWVRPPNEVYGQALLHRLEGGEVRYRPPIKSTTLTLTVLAGNSHLELNDIGNADVKNVRGWNAQWETEWVTLRAGRVWGDVTVGTTDRYTFTGFGATVDRNNIFL